MSVITKVEAKSLKGKLFLSGVTLALVIGGVTMVYPFVLMLAGSLRSQMDASDIGPMPTYLVSFPELVGKFAETKYNYDPELMNRHRQTRDFTFREVQYVDPGQVDRTALTDYEEFATGREMPPHWRFLGGTEIKDLITSHIYAEFSRRVRQRYNHDLALLNRDLGAPLRSWAQLNLPAPDWLRSGYVYEHSPVYEEYFKLTLDRPLAETAFANLTAYFLEHIIYPRHGRWDVDGYNQAHAVPIASYDDFAIPRRVPDQSQPLLREEWLTFVFDDYLNLSFVRSDADNRQYQEFIRELFDDDIDTLRRYWPDAEYESFAEIELPDDHHWIADFRRRHYAEFLQSLEPEQLRLVGPEFEWADFLEARYETLDQLNAARDRVHTDWSAARMPVVELESLHVAENRGQLRRMFASRNFRVVFNQVFVQGRAFMNSMIYVGLALFFSLTLQPMVAYSLSRFNPPGTWKIIFIFVATMAFPPMVALIPQFLIIQHLNLLNTFIALVMPVVINGYQIFLLKGFFDSIPQDLYDAALVDGASELHMFRHITIALSYPILAVIALGTFNSAWMAFMYPLIVCPDERMHVLAVWLQQFQQSAPTPAVFASILIASIPSLLIFLLAQRTIMRGIAVPAEK